MFKAKEEEKKNSLATFTLSAVLISLSYPMMRSGSLELSFAKQHLLSIRPADKVQKSPT